MKVVDLFAGCGGLAQGFKEAGFECSGFVEYWEPAIETFLHNHPEAKLIGKDITQISEEEISNYEADVIVGGPPCQGFSMAGKRDVNDQRNTLFEDYLKFVRILKPEYCVMENVKGIHTMKTKSGEYVFNKIIDGFEKIGYDVKAKLLNAGNYGVPEARERVIFIAAKKGLLIEYPERCSKKVLVKNVLDLPYEEDKNIQHVYEKNDKMFVKGHYLKEGEVFSTFHSAGKKLKWNGLSPTITKGGRFIHPKYNRFLSVREEARIQSFPDTYVFKGNIRQMYGQIGNAVPVKLAKAIAQKITKMGGLDGIEERSKRKKE